MLNNLDKHLEKAEATASFAPPTGTRAEQGAELIRRCRERDKKLEAQALECERAGDALRSERQQEQTARHARRAGHGPLA